MFFLLQGAGSWLTGTYRSNVQKASRVYRGLFMDWGRTLDKALDNLHQCLWFGILEDRERSIELLEYQTGLKLTYQHIGSREYPLPSAEEVKMIKRLIPVDLYIYEYAKQLFSNRWKWYLLNEKEKNQGFYAVPKHPVFPEVIDGCVSSPNYLKCPGEKEWTGEGFDEKE